MKMLITILLLLSIIPVSGICQGPEEGTYKFLENAYTTRTSNTLRYLVSEHQQFLAMFWETANTDAVLFMLGSLYEENEDYARAFLSYLKFKFIFPNSNRRKDAISNLNQIIHNKDEKAFVKKRKEIDELVSQSLSYPDLNDAFYAYLDFAYSLNIEDLNEILPEEIRFYCERYAKNVKNADQLSYRTGDIYSRLSDYHEAIVAYSKINYIAPQSPLIPQALYQIGRLQYQETGEYQKSKDTFVKLIAAYPETPVAGDGQFYLAELYEEKLDKPDEAVTNYRILVETYPKSQYAVKSLQRVADIMADKEKYTEAIASYHQIFELYPQDPFAPNALLEIESIYRRKLEKYEKAIEVLKLYATQFSLREDAAERLYDAAEMYVDELNNKEAAISTYNEVISKFPNSNYAEKAKDKIEDLKKE
jgi:TolA-binding protein